MSPANSLAASKYASPAKSDNLFVISPFPQNSPAKGSDQLQFLSPLAAFDTIICGPLALVNEVPVGVKSNVRFLVSGEYSKSKKTGKHIYVDDVFINSVGRSKTFYYLMPYRTTLSESGDTFYSNEKGKGIAP